MVVLVRRRRGGSEKVREARGILKAIHFGIKSPRSISGNGMREFQFRLFVVVEEQSSPGQPSGGGGGESRHRSLSLSTIN